MIEPSRNPFTEQSLNAARNELFLKALQFAALFNTDENTGNVEFKLLCAARAFDASVRAFDPRLWNDRELAAVETCLPPA